MNAEQKAEILKQNKYRHNQYHAHKHVWALGVHVVASDSSFAKATHAAYDHYLNSFPQAANDLAGQEAYEETRLETLEKENDDLKTQIVNLASESIVLEQQNEALRAENEALKAERKRVISCLNAIAGSGSHVFAVHYANNMLNELEGAPTPEQVPAPLAQAEASEVTLDKPVFKVGDKVRIIQAYYKSPDEYEKISAISPAGFYTLTINETGEVLADYIEARHIQPYIAPAPKKAIPARMRVNWNQRGFSSGSYEVLGYSQEKQCYMLNISTDDTRPMLKAVKMADCLAVRS